MQVGWTNHATSAGESRLHAEYDHLQSRVDAAREERFDKRFTPVIEGDTGIGFETTRGLLARGARVLLGARDEEKSARACDRLRSDFGAEAPVSAGRLDLSDLDSVARFAADLPPGPVDILVANAGIWPRRHALSAQGHEIAFATNVLGHVLLVRLLEPRLGPGARVVVLTGDIYAFARDCTPDYRYRGALGGTIAYCRSKLGNLWLVAELQRRRPDLVVVEAHPGVVASGLGGQAGTRARWPEIGCARGAQTPLWCATQPDVEPGGYYHNTLGRVLLGERDPLRDAGGARRLWDTCERLCEPWLPVTRTR
jgi:NAD(P)-dependent dehydrogenase (short-subunit alcohol dehydrogenase family)